MELRKVQLTGGSSITVTLPKAWTERANLRPGDVVGCTQLPDGSLAVTAHARAERSPSRYAVDAQEGDADYVFRKIVAAYLMGYESIAVASRRPLSSSARAAVRTAVRRIIGLEVVEEEPNAIVLQDFLDPREFHMEKALRRMGMLTRAMQDEALGALVAPGEEAVRSVQDRDDEVDRLYWLVNKQYHAILRDASFAARMDTTPSQALNLLLVARLVERTADHADRVVRQAVAIPRGRSTDAFLAKLEREGRKAADLFGEALQTFHRADAKQANGVIEGAGRFLKGQEKLLKEAASFGGETVERLVFVVESVARTAAYAADVGEVAINHKVARG